MENSVLFVRYEDGQSGVLVNTHGLMFIEPRGILPAEDIPDDAEVFPWEELSVRQINCIDAFYECPYKTYFLTGMLGRAELALKVQQLLGKLL